eukprot:scaffold965_cov120-Isochrysis_galbana.AAC.2
MSRKHRCSRHRPSFGHPRKAVNLKKAEQGLDVQNEPDGNLMASMSMWSRCRPARRPRKRGARQRAPPPC